MADRKLNLNIDEVLASMTKLSGLLNEMTEEAVAFSNFLSDNYNESNLTFEKKFSDRFSGMSKLISEQTDTLGVVTNQMRRYGNEMNQFSDDCHVNE